MIPGPYISTGAAIRALGFYLSPHTFRYKYRDLIPWITTPGGHYRWLKVAVEAEAAMMKHTG
jgi:hypothetical protein